MPGHNVVIRSVAFCQLTGEGHGIFLVDGAVGTGIVAASEFPPAAFKIRSQDLGIPFGHPRRVGSGRGGHAHLQVIFTNQLHNLIQPFKMIGYLIGLKGRPAEYVQCHAVNPCETEHAHVLFPNRFVPLLRIIIAAI